MAAVVLALIGVFLILQRRDLATAFVRPFFGLLLVLTFAGTGLDHCGTLSCERHPDISWPVSLIVIGYGAVVAFWLYRRFGQRFRERRQKDLERARDVERVRVYPPDEGEESDVR
jgi:membrane protein implicated in regulation of membrane protease activity